MDQSAAGWRGLSSRVQMTTVNNWSSGRSEGQAGLEDLLKPGI